MPETALSQPSLPARHETVIRQSHKPLFLDTVAVLALAHLAAHSACDEFGQWMPRTSTLLSLFKGQGQLHGVVINKANEMSASCLPEHKTALMPLAIDLAVPTPALSFSPCPTCDECPPPCEVAVIQCKQGPTCDPGSECTSLDHRASLTRTETTTEWPPRLQPLDVIMAPIRVHPAVPSSSVKGPPGKPRMADGRHPYDVINSASSLGIKCSPEAEDHARWPPWTNYHRQEQALHYSHPKHAQEHIIEPETALEPSLSKPVVSPWALPPSPLIIGGMNMNGSFKGNHLRRDHRNDVHMTLLSQ